MTNLRVLISNVTVIFLKFQPKNTQIRHFWSQIQTFSFFPEILQFDKFKGADFKYDNRFLKFLPQNTQISHFWSHMQAFLLFHKISQIDKSEGADFKYDNSILKFQPKNTQIRHLWFQIQVFSFFTKFCSWINLMVLISNMKIVF